MESLKSRPYIRVLIYLWYTITRCYVQNHRRYCFIRLLARFACFFTGKGYCVRNSVFCCAAVISILENDLTRRNAIHSLEIYV